MSGLSAEILLSEIDDILRTMPEAGAASMNTPDAIAWTGRTNAVMHAAGNITISTITNRMASSSPDLAQKGCREALVLLQTTRYSLLLKQGKTGAAVARAVDAGNVFDYFDEVRKICERAKQSLFFVDPYMDVDFISRYMPQVSAGVTVRLLTAQNGNSLGPASALAARQGNLSIELRQGQGFHDRYVFVDSTECVMSGTSFSAGAKKGPTALVPVLDFAGVLAQHEQLWSQATPKP